MPEKGYDRLSKDVDYCKVSMAAIMNQSTDGSGGSIVLSVGWENGLSTDVSVVWRP